MVADAHQHDVDLVVIGNARDVGKKTSIAGMIDRWSVLDGNDEAGRHTRGNRRRIFVFAHGRSVQGRNKTNLQLALEQLELAADVPRRVGAGLIAWITENTYDRGRQIGVRNELRASFLGDLNTVTDVIAMAMS